MLAGFVPSGRTVRARQASAHDPQPCRKTQQGLGRGRKAVIEGLEAVLEAGGLGFTVREDVEDEGTPRLLAEAGKHVLHPRIGPGGLADFQTGDAPFFHELFKRPEFQGREKVVRHFGVLFHQCGAPPHGQVVPGPQMLFQKLALHTHAAGFVGPRGQLVADGQQPFVQLDGDGNPPVRDAALVPYRHQRVGSRAVGKLRVVQENQGAHGLSL